MSAEKKPERALDALNFFLADVRDGLGPYLAIYLLTIQHWDEASIGLVMTIGGIAGLLVQTPAGALIDSSTAKRGLIVLAAVVVTLCSLALPFVSSFPLVALAQAATSAAGSIFQPAIAAITLGIMGPKSFARRNGRNEAFNHAGNAVAATLAGIGAYFMGPIAVFYLMTFMAVASVLSTLRIPAEAIDHELARGLHEGPAGGGDAPSGLKVLLTSRPLLIFAVCVVMFHFANAAMLPLVGQKLALTNKHLGATLMSACIVAAQLVMIPIAILVGAKADAWGRKPFFLVGFSILAARGALYTVSDNPFWLVGVQALDGVGAGIFGALFPLVVNDLTAGAGRFNVSQGAITTAIGVGASLSTAIAGMIVVAFGYSAAFIVLTIVAAIGGALYAFAMPETREDQRGSAEAPVMPAQAAAKS